MKNKKSTLSKKIKSYSALAGSIIAASSAADAQVVYTNVSPDAVVNTPGGFYNLDLNNDGIIDFKIVTNTGTSGIYVFDFVEAIPSKAANAIVDIADAGYADTLNTGMAVCPTSTFADSAECVNTYAGLLGWSVTPYLPPAYIPVPNFTGTSGKFLGLRFEKTGLKYYGWVRLNVDNDCKSFTIIDYAYKNNPDGCSITGLTTDVGISESAANKVTIFAAEQNINVQLDQTIPAEGTITVTNLLGQEIVKLKVENASIVIPMLTEKTGVYMVTFTQSTGTYTKKVSIQ